MEESTTKALSMRGRFVSRKKGKPLSGRSQLRGKSRTRSMSPGQSMRRCWTYGKHGHYNKDCKLRGVGIGKDSEVIQSTKGKLTKD